MKRIFGSFASCWSCAETASHAILSPSLCQQANSIFAASSQLRMTHMGLATVALCIPLTTLHNKIMCLWSTTQSMIVSNYLVFDHLSLNGTQVI